MTRLTKRPAPLSRTERTMLTRDIRRPVSDLAELVFEPPSDGAGTAYESVRAATGNDPELIRFEPGLRPIVQGLLDRVQARGPGAGTTPDPDPALEPLRTRGQMSGGVGSISARMALTALSWPSVSRRMRAMAKMTAANDTSNPPGP